MCATAEVLCVGEGGEQARANKCEAENAFVVGLRNAAFSAAQSSWTGARVSGRGGVLFSLGRVSQHAARLSRSASR